MNLQARTLLATCFNLKKQNSVLIAFDREGKQNDETLAKEARRHELEVTEFHITRDDDAERPVMELAELMQQNEATIFCVNQRRIVTYGHSDARIAAVDKGRKIGFLTQDVSMTPSASELARIHARSNRLGKLLDRTERVEITTGSKPLKLEFALGRRKSFPLSSILVNKGDWGAIPDYAEAAIAPLEDSAEGEVEIDGMIMGYGKLRHSIVLEFRNGKLAGFRGREYSKKLKQILGSEEESQKTLCELGLGANHLRTKIIGEFDDKKMLGSAHIAIGDNHTIGGSNVASLHIDFLTLRPQIAFDGKQVNLFRA